MADTFLLEVATPERLFIREDVSEAQIPAANGYVGILPGHASLPNGFGVDFTEADGEKRVPGVAPNDLTSADWRDAFAGTPWHKHVPARIEALTA